MSKTLKLLSSILLVAYSSVWAISEAQTSAQLEYEGSIMLQLTPLGIPQQSLTQEKKRQLMEDAYR